MLLCADIGNSHTVIGLLDDGAGAREVLDHWRVATDERRTADEWAVLLGGLLRESAVGDRVTGVAVCATVPAVLRPVSKKGATPGTLAPASFEPRRPPGCGPSPG